MIFLDATMITQRTNKEVDGMKQNVQPKVQLPVKRVEHYV